MFMAGLFTTAKRWKPKCPLMDEGRNKMWHTYRMKYYSALRRKGILIHAI